MNAARDTLYDPYSVRDAEISAIELLAPRRLAAPYLKRLPELKKVVAMARALEISKMAAACRYVELHQSTLAIVFIHNETVSYLQRSTAFPWLALASGDTLPPLPDIPSGSKFSDMEEVDAELWFGRPSPTELAAQVLRQQDGRAMVLLEAS